MAVDRCICCGAVIPEGRQVCPKCKSMTVEEALKEIVENGIELGAGDYVDVNALKVARKVLEKQIKKKPKHIVKKYGKHKWQRKENGEVDEFAFDYEYHNGVACEVCGITVCVHCEPDYDKLEDCKKSYYVCPTCKKETGFMKTYCDCGQKLDWNGVRT